MGRHLKIGFVTCSDLGRYFPAGEAPLFTHDDKAAVDALHARGHVVEPVVWGRPVEALEAEGWDLLVIRSPWDYMDSADKRAGFTAWLAALATSHLRVENPPDLLAWNLDKRYLADLERAGVAVVPSLFVGLAERAELDLEALVGAIGALVIKPCVSAAAQDTFRIDTPAEARQFDLGVVGPDRDLLIQPFLPVIESAGEWSCVFIDGRMTHAVLKKPKPGSWFVQDELGGSVASGDPPAEVRALALRASARLPEAYPGELSGPPLYARVDVIPVDPPLVGELELIEPELFFLARIPEGSRPHDETLEAFIDALERRGN